MANKSDDIESSFNLTGTERSRSQGLLYFSVFVIWAPGVVFNAIALVFIAKDMRKAMFPALVLLLLLCIFDSMDIWATIVSHVLTRVISTTDAMCAFSTFFFNFFAVAAGATNSFLAIDRVLAIRYPFYYKAKFSNYTWVKVCLITGCLISIFCLFPMIGLGDMWTKVGDKKYCSLSYREDPVERIFGLTFSSLELVYVVILIVCNTVLVKELMKMKNKIAVAMPSSTVTDSSNPSSDGAKKAINPVEVVFAKVMIALSLAYLILGTPARVIFLLKQLKISVGYPAFTGTAHSLNGLLRVVNPIIYILIRKVDRRKLFNAFCICVKRQD